MSLISSTPFLARLRRANARRGSGSLKTGQGYVMLARSGGQGGGRALAGRGVSPPRLFLSGVGRGELNSPENRLKILTILYL